MPLSLAPFKRAKQICRPRRKKLGVKRFMNVFVARQPIFDKLKRVVAYELLFRSGFENFFSAGDGELATQTVISSAVHTFGLTSLTGGKPAFINFTKPLLINKLALVLPPTHLVVELLETLEPDREVLEACQELKRHGYFIALDDFVLRPGYEPLISVADIVKVDFLTSEGEGAEANCPFFDPLKSSASRRKG